MNTAAMQSAKPHIKQTANPFPGPHNQPFNELNYTVELTRDNSPTLRLKPTDDELRANRMAEAMHHSGGAASESWYIYGTVLEKVFKNAFKIESLQVCSVGLGLGYVEMMWALNSLFHGKPKTSLDSFEIDEDLVSFFKCWALQEDKPTSAVYDLAFSKLIETNQNIETVQQSQVQQYLSEALRNDLQIHGNLLDYKDQKKWNVICFDAFSKKFSEDIWREDFFNDFLKNHCADDCVFTTYGYTAELKRALMQNNFSFIERPGFSNKRRSTLAVRGDQFTYDLQTHYAR